MSSPKCQQKGRAQRSSIPREGVHGDCCRKKTPTHNLRRQIGSAKFDAMLSGHFWCYNCAVQIPFCSLDWMFLHKKWNAETKTAPNRFERAKPSGITTTGCIAGESENPCSNVPHLCNANVVCDRSLFPGSEHLITRTWVSFSVKKQKIKSKQPKVCQCQPIRIWPTLGRDLETPAGIAERLAALGTFVSGISRKVLSQWFWRIKKQFFRNNKQVFLFLCVWMESIWRIAETNAPKRNVRSFRAHAGSAVVLGAHEVQSESASVFNI